MDKHRFYGRRQPVYDSADMVAASFRLVAAASDWVYDAQFMGIIQTVDVNFPGLDDEIHPGEIRRIKNVSAGETRVLRSRAWRDDLRWHLGNYRHGNGCQHRVSNTFGLKGV